MYFVFAVLVLTIACLSCGSYGAEFTTSARYPAAATNNVHRGHRHKSTSRGGGGSSSAAAAAAAANAAQDERRDLDENFMSQPSPCVWAILACCSPTNFHFRFGCFPYLGCTALFWETDPCQLRTVLDAATEALRFYEQFDKRPTTTPPPPSPTPPPTVTTSTANGSGAENSTTSTTTSTTPAPTTTATTATTESSAPETTAPAASTS